MDYSQAVKCAILSQEVYQHFTPELRFREFPNLVPELIDQATTHTQCAILGEATGNSIYIVFRGSETRVDWQTNLQFRKNVIENQILEKDDQVYPNEYEGKNTSSARMHQGFVSAYLSVRESIHNYIKTHNVSSVTVTGHSLGGALAILCAVDIQYNFARQVGKIEVYSYGAPRVGNNDFLESFNRRVPNSYRFVLGMDIVPALPRRWQGYRHVNTEYRIGQRWSWRFLSQRFRDHEIQNYISVLQELVTQSS